MKTLTHIGEKNQNKYFKISVVMKMILHREKLFQVLQNMQF